MSCEISGYSEFSWAVTHLAVLKFSELIKLINHFAVDVLIIVCVLSLNYIVDIHVCGQISKKLQSFPNVYKCLTTFS